MEEAQGAAMPIAPMTSVEKEFIDDALETFKEDGVRGLQRSVSRVTAGSSRLRALLVQKAAMEAEPSFLNSALHCEWEDGGHTFARYDPINGKHLLSRPIESMGTGAVNPDKALAFYQAFFKTLAPEIVQEMLNDTVSGRLSVVEGEESTKDNRRLIHLAIRMTDDDALLRFLIEKNGPRKWTEHKPDELPLALAAKLGRKNAVRLLLAAGESPTEYLEFRKGAGEPRHPRTLTAIEEAAKEGRWDILRALVAAAKVYQSVRAPESVDTQLASKTRLNDPHPAPLGSVASAKVWLHAVSCSPRDSFGSDDLGERAQEARDLFAKRGDGGWSAEGGRSWFSRLVGRGTRAKEPDGAREAARKLFFCAMANANWASAREALGMLGDLGAKDVRGAERPAAFLSMALALAALDQDPPAKSGSDPSDRPLSRTGNLEPQGAFLSRPARSAFWLELLRWAKAGSERGEPLAAAVLAGFSESEPSADGMRQAQWFALFNQPSGIEALAAAGVDVLCESDLESAPSSVLMAVRGGCVEALEALWKNGATLASERRSALLSAIENGEEAVFARAGELLVKNDPKLAERACAKIRQWMRDNAAPAAPWLSRRLDALEIAASAEAGARETLNAAQESEGLAGHADGPAPAAQKRHGPHRL
jgi:hypothetical protein